MRRSFPNSELFCKKCHYVGHPNEFSGYKEKWDDVYCPECNSDKVVAASTVDWCDFCEKNPQAKCSDLCDNCTEEQNEVITAMIESEDEIGGSQ